MERNGFRKFIPAEYSDRVMSLNRLEERNFQKKLNYIHKENRMNINSIERDMHKISLELEGQQKLLEKSKTELKLKQLNTDLNNLMQNRRVRSAFTPKINYFSSEMNNEFESKLIPQKPFIRNQTAKQRTLSDSKILLSRRANTANPTLRDAKKIVNNNSNDRPNSQTPNEDSNKLSDDSNEAFFVRVKRVKSSSIANVLRKTPLTVKSAKPYGLHQASLPSFPSGNDLNKANVLNKFEEIFDDLI